ncbi:MAG: FAD-dependent 5-carboxymethylaminomethyl-2-thiouridine(34) oxidoreductase MnmC [Ottowia sp.]
MTAMTDFSPARLADLFAAQLPAHWRAAPHWHALAVCEPGRQIAPILAALLAVPYRLQNPPGDGPSAPRLALTLALPGDAPIPALDEVLAELAPLLPAADSADSPDPHETLAALRHTLAPQWHGLLPGVHALALDESARLILSIAADTASALRQLHGPAHLIAWLGAPDEAALKALPPLCQPQACLHLADPANAAAPVSALRACGFVPEESGESAANNQTAPLWRFAPHWQARPRPGSADAAQTIAALPPTAAPARCFIVGAGLAGASLARSLALRGWQVTVLCARQRPADEASGLPAGVAAPHISPDDRPLSRLSRAGVRHTLASAAHLLPQGEGWSWARSGVLERHTPGQRRPPAAWAHLPAPAHPGSAPACAETRATAHLPPDAPALWHAHAGWLRPPALVSALLAAALPPGCRGSITWRGGQRVARLRLQGTIWQALDESGRLLAEAELPVIAAGHASQALLAASFAQTAPIHPLRGQAAFGPAPAPDTPEAAALPPFPVNGHGNFIPNAAGQWIAGSTFERGQTEPTATAANHAANAQRLAELLPATAAALQAQWLQAGQFAAVRCTAPDRLPLIGPLPAACWQAQADQPSSPLPPWLFTALGSRGLSLSLLTAEIATCWLHGEPLPAPLPLARSLLTARHATRPLDLA